MIKNLMSMIFLSILFVFQVQSTEFAATMTVFSDNVTFQRTQTLTPLSLPDNAVAPIGIGDTIDTGDNGRVLIEVLEVATIFVLPQTQLTIKELTQQDDTIDLDVKIEGIALFDVQEPLDLMIDGTDFQLIDGFGMFGVWALADEQKAVVVNDGMTTIEIDENEIQLADAQAWIPLLNDDPIDAIAPFNPANLIGNQLGCDANVNTIRQEGLLVRAGNGLGYEAIGLFEEGSSINIIGSTSDQSRLRVQIDSGFGWVERLGVEFACDVKFIYEGEQFENNARIFGVTEPEIDYLEPYFSMPLVNNIFYPQIDN